MMMMISHWSCSPGAPRGVCKPRLDLSKCSVLAQPGVTGWLQESLGEMRLTQEGTRPSWSLLALRWLCCSLGSLGAGGAGAIWGGGGK